MAKTKPPRKVFLVEAPTEYLIWERAQDCVVQTQISRHRGRQRLMATLQEFDGRYWKPRGGPFVVIGVFPSKRKAIVRRRELAIFKMIHST